jgi:hypothetical protein
MSTIKQQLAIREELKRINQEIDRKIVRGKPYRKEANYHKVLLSRLSVLRRRAATASAFSFISSFLF